jgi:hypothetical protein
MAKRHYYLDSRVLTAFFFAAMPFVAFGSFVVVNMAQSQLRESVGVGLEQRAVQTKLVLESHIGEQIVDLRLLALMPVVQKALARSAPPVDPKEIRRKQKAWATNADARLQAALLESVVAARLRDVTAVRPGLRSIQVVDTHGRVVAASGRGGRLFHGEMAWFKELAAQEGQPMAWIGDIERVTGSSMSALEVGYPVRDEAGLFKGAIRGLLDARSLYHVLSPVRIGRTGHATLIRASDGMILASDEGDRILNASFPGFASLSGAVEGFPLTEGGEAIFGKARIKRGYWTIQEVRADVEGQQVVIEPARIVGFSPVDQIPGVSWLVTVEQDLEEAVHPITGVTRYLWVHFIGVLATVILLALYFSFKLERPVMDDDLHLHEEHIPASFKARAAADRDE